jgi:hypothetical protein
MTQSDLPTPVRAPLPLARRARALSLLRVLWRADHRWHSARRYDRLRGDAHLARDIGLPPPEPGLPGQQWHGW